MQTLRELVIPASIWERKGDLILRLMGEAEDLLARHIGEVADVAIIDANEREVITFRATLSRFTSNGHHYVVVFFPKRLAPMVPAIEQLKDSKGRIWLSIKLLGVKRHSRRIAVKEEEGGGGG